jgi:tRNA pseudouridine38-40 synthase
MRAFRLAYDGDPFHGFQRQPDVPTVADALLDALAALDVTDGAKPPGYAPAGRTDAGVSALAQTVAFEAPDWLDPSALNGALPDSIRAWAHADVPADFHATADARERTYVYHLHAPEEVVDDDRARAALRGFAGEHDFHNLTPDDEGTVRTLSTACRRDGPILELELGADGFPRQLVRRVVGVVASVARGEATLDRVDRVLAREPLPGHAGVPPAPPHPLVLVDVDYGIDFTVDPDAADEARRAFDARRGEYRERAAAAGAIAEAVGE